MISISELVLRLRKLKQEYLDERVDFVLKAADNATALMKIRVINERVNAEGQIFGIYAESTIKKKKSRNSDTGDKRINFSDTNRMWSGTGVSGRGVKAKLIESVDGRISVLVQPEDDQNRIEVLEILEGKYGDIISWSKKEQALLINIWEKRFEDLVKRHGF